MESRENANNLEQRLLNAEAKLQKAVEELEEKNIELFSVNADNQQKIADLIKANADFDNLLINAEIGALYIDMDLCIRKITPIMCRNTNLYLSDTGRNISKLNFMDHYPDFGEDVSRCLEEKCTLEKEVYKNGKTWMIRIRPYYISEEKIDGVLVTLFDISKRLEAAKYELKLLTNSVPGGVARMRYDDGLILEYGNDGLYQLMNLDKDQLDDEDPIHYESLLKDKDWKLLQEKIEQGIRTGEMIRMEYEVIKNHKLTEWRLMQAMVLERGHVPILQCIITDITEQKNTEAMMDSLIQNMAGGIMRAYYDGVSAEIVFLSDSVYRMFGYTREEYEKKRGEKNGFYILGKYEEKMIREAREAMEGTPIPPGEYHLIKQDGSDLWIDMRAEVVSRTGQGILIQYILIDNTEEHEIFEQMRMEKEKLDIIAEIAADMLFEYDVKKDSMHYTSQREEGLDAEQISDNYLEVIQSDGWVHPDDQMELLDFCEQMRGGRQHVHTQLRKRFTDRKYHWVEVDGRTIYDDNGDAERVIGKITNIDDRMEKEHLLKVSSERDSLTGLYNHMTCVNRIRKQLKTLKGDETAVLMICDIDNFKQINDKNGHLFGDAVLCTFADELRTVFPRAVKGRIGGDEFLILVKNMNQEQVEKKLYQLNHQFSRLNAEDGEIMRISCSIGSVVCTSAEHDYEKAFRMADNALYKVKNGNKGIFLFSRMDEDGDILSQSYLASKAGKEDYSREETLIRTDEELVLFSLELLDNVTDARIGLKMVSDRICRYFGFDDIVCLHYENGEYSKIYHWGSIAEAPFTNEELNESQFGWNYVQGKYDEQGVAILQQSEMKNLPGRVLGSLFMVKYQESGNESRVVVFMDRLTERNWDVERATLLRLANIIDNRILQLQNEEKNKEKLELQVNYDSLTGLPNYSKFLSLCEQYLQGKEIKDGHSYYFAYADFNNFQYLNERYGYSVGDAVLKRFANSLTACPKGIYFTRITSDHFIGLLRESEDTLEEIQEYLENFCEEVNREYPMCNLILICGACRVEHADAPVSVLVDYANVARKYGKHKAETCCILYTEDIREHNETEMSIIANMSSALENHEFQVYLQPKVNLYTEKSVGAEALVRWIRPDGSMFYPDQFIPVFERNGFITKVDFYVLEEVLAYLRQAIDQGEEVVPVSVNFSRLHNNDDQFVDKIQALLEKYKIDPSLLEAEVTESVYMYDLKGLQQKIHHLQELGVLISIDDFGSGYSSLNVLSKVPADIIKLDRQFLIEDEGGATPEFIKYLINMIKHLGCKIIAEGVETREQAEMLKGANCDMVQGYYYARPMPIADFRRFLSEFNREVKE